MSTDSGTITPISGASTLYATLAEVKVRLGITDTDDDATLNSVLEAVSRLIDDYCGRRFYTTDADEDRYFTSEHGHYVRTDDIVSVSSVHYDYDGDGIHELTATVGTDYILGPRNAASKGQPYGMLEIVQIAFYPMPKTWNGVKVTGKFGWSAVPSPVAEACALQTIRLFKRKDAPFGVIGSADMGQLITISKLDPDVQLLLEVYRAGRKY